MRSDYIQYLLDSRKDVLNAVENLPKVIETEFGVSKDTKLKDVRNKKIALELTDDDITAQALDFFYGGFYSTASLMYFCVYELGINPKIQEKLRKEVDETFERQLGKINYDALTKMKYLDMVISGTYKELFL